MKNLLQSDNDAYLFNLIYENTSDMIFLLQREEENYYNYILVNKTFEEIIKIGRESIIGKRFGELIPVELSERIIKKFNEAVSRKEMLRFEMELELKNIPIIFDASISPVFEDNSVKILVIARDITERKKHEDELIRAKTLSEESNKLKSALLSNMSHEVRTPLNGIIGSAELLKLETQINDHNEILENIIQASKRLLYTLHSIIELSQLESMSKPVYSKTVTISHTISNVIKDYRKNAEEKNLELIFEIRKENIEVHIDEYFLSQILHHLLQNAIKFTSNGGIRVQVDEAVINKDYFAVINVIDTGIGISTEEQKYIFEKFRQGSEGKNRKNEGAGLGLTLAKTMTEIMGGEISLKSELKKGSTFTLKFPSINKASFAVNKEASKKLSEKNKILLVEDNNQNAKLISIFLNNKYELKHVQDAAEAVNEMLNNSYSAVLMDINLGKGLNGFDIIKQVKSNINDFETPIVAMTGYALNVDREFLLSNGFNYFLAKPFDREMLNKVLDKCLDKEFQQN